MIESQYYQIFSYYLVIYRWVLIAIIDKGIY